MSADFSSQPPPRPPARSRFGWGVLGSLLPHLFLLGAISTWGAWQQAPEPEPVKASVGVTIIRPKPVVPKPVKPTPTLTKATQEVVLLDQSVKTPPPEKPKPKAEPTPAPEPEPPPPSETTVAAQQSASAKPTPAPPKLVPTPTLGGTSKTASLVATSETPSIPTSSATSAAALPKAGETVELAPLNLSAPSATPSPSAPVQPTLKPKPSSPIKSKHSKKTPSAQKQAAATPAPPKPVPAKQKSASAARPEQPKVQSRKPGSKKVQKPKQPTLQTPTPRTARKTAKKTPAAPRLTSSRTPLVKPKTSVLPSPKAKLSLPKVKAGEVSAAPRLSGTQLPKPKIAGIGKIATPKPTLKTTKSGSGTGSFAASKPSLKAPKLTAPTIAPGKSATSLATAVPSKTEIALPTKLDPALPAVSNTDLLAAPSAPAPASLDAPTLDNSLLQDEALINTPQDELPLVLEVESVVDADQQGELNLSGFEAIKEFQKAEREYNLHIQGKILPKVGGASRKDRFVRIRLEIAVSGKILRHEVVETEASAGFVRKVRAAIRLARLAPLPEALAKKPPYIVVVKFTPKD